MYCIGNIVTVSCSALISHADFKDAVAAGLGCGDDYTEEEVTAGARPHGVCDVLTSAFKAVTTSRAWGGHSCRCINPGAFAALSHCSQSREPTQANSSWMDTISK